MTSLTSNDRGRTWNRVFLYFLAAIMLTFVAAIVFGAVVGWIAYGGDIFLHAVAEGWALCY